MNQQPVPFLDLITPHRELEDELVSAFRDALRGAAFIGGTHVEGFEREFADYCGVAHCVGVANGTDAVRFALMASGVGHGDAVVTVSHTFIATVEAISQAGAATEFVDIDERTYCMSPERLAEYLEGCTQGSADRPAARPPHRQANQGHGARASLWSGGRHGPHRGDCRRLRSGGGRGCLSGPGCGVSLGARRLAACRLVRQGRRASASIQARILARAARRGP